MIIKHENNKITFIFDQNSNSKVYLGGDFNSWNYLEDPLKFADNKWQITKTLKPGAYQFKYVIKDIEENWYNDWRADAYIKSPLGCDNSVVIID
jgi:1,4-alpha-glucan branching enzyme